MNLQLIPVRLSVGGQAVADGVAGFGTMVNGAGIMPSSILGLGPFFVDSANHNDVKHYSNSNKVKDDGQNRYSIVIIHIKVNCLIVHHTFINKKISVSSWHT